MRAVLLVLVLLSAACVSIVRINDKWVSERVWNQEREVLRQRGAQELECPIDDVNVALVDTLDEFWPREVEITGCGHTRRYLYRDKAWAVTTEEAAASVPQPEPESRP